MQIVTDKNKVALSIYKNKRIYKQYDIYGK